MSTSTQIVPITANNNFPIRLISSNFAVWRRQITSTLIGLNLDNHITESPPSKYIDNDKSKPNPAYNHWFRQDQIIVSAILGSLSETIQPIVAAAETSKEAWTCLTNSYASASRSRIISLKSKLAKNPKINRTISKFLQEMKTISDELALAQSPVEEEDLIIHILAQLGDEYNHIIAALKVREKPISYSELFDKLVDHERSIKDIEQSPMITTVNYTQHQQGSHQESRSNRPWNQNNSRNRSQWSNNTNPQRDRFSRTNTTYCQYCRISGHDTKDCRKLARFLKENNIVLASQNTHTVNTTTARPTSPTPPWMFDTGASHHVTSNRSSLHSLSEYGGPDEIVLDNGSSHGGATHEGSEQQ